MSEVDDGAPEPATGEPVERTGGGGLDASRRVGRVAANPETGDLLVLPHRRRS